MSILLVFAIGTAMVAAAFYWWLNKLQHHENAPGALSHVVLPAALGPIALLLSFVFLMFGILYWLFG